MPKHWKLKPKYSAETYAQVSGVPPLALQLLFNRGLTEEKDIQTFLDPKYEDQHSPFLFQDMQKAIDRIWQAIERKEKICIYGDYDADAVTANAVLQQAFRFLEVEVSSYIPDRFSEGYGLNLEAFEKIKQQGVTVVITVDCGTNSVDAADFCAQNGMDLIITDHHEIIGEKPNALALINPKNPGDTYPYHEITGVGVAYKLAKALLDDPKSQIQNPKIVPGTDKWLLDLVAIGTVADCHSLMGENRILVKYGLRVLPKTKWPGLRALCLAAGLDFSEKLPDTYTLGFTLAPRLNAAGRLEHADVALHTLMESDPVEAGIKAEKLNEINTRRQDQTLRIVSEAKDQAYNLGDRKVLVLMAEEWNKGIVGLVAGRITEEFHKPSIVLSKEGEFATGSARTVGEFSVVEALKHASEYLVRFGGHQQAAGLTLRTEHFQQFYGKVLEYAEANLVEEEKVLELEAELFAQDLQPTTYNLIASFEPFGVDNVKPKFLISGMRIASTKLVGREGAHMQFKLALAGKEIEGIQFNCGDFVKTLKIGDTVDAAAELLEDSWNGNKKLKLRIVDMRMA